MKISFFVRQVSAALLTAALLAPAGFADEGMWTFDNPPQAASGEVQFHAHARSGSITCACPASGSTTAGPARLSARMVCC